MYRKQNNEPLVTPENLVTIAELREKTERTRIGKEKKRSGVERRRGDKYLHSIFNKPHNNCHGIVWIFLDRLSSQPLIKQFNYQ